MFYYFILFSGVFALSTSALFAKVAEAPSAIIAFYRLAFSVFLLFPAVALKKQYGKELKKMTLKDGYFALFSGFCLALHYVLWFESLNYTSVASSTILVTLQPLFAVIGGYFFFKERYRKKALFGILIALCGSCVIGLDDFQTGFRALFGDFLAFVAAAVITAYFFIGQYLRRRLSALPYSFLGYVSGSFFLALYALMQGNAFNGYSAQTWQCFLGIALVSTLLGQVILNWLLKVFSASIISMGILTEAVFASILSYFLLGEKVLLQQAIGMGVILTGLVLFLRCTREKPSA